MKVKDLLGITRQALRDVVHDRQWDDATLVGHLSEAQEKAARNARLLRDFTTPEICRINVNTSRQYYDLDKRVIFVRLVLLGDRTVPLPKKSYKDLHAYESGWIDRTGTPSHWCGDFESGRLWFNRKPTVAAVAKLLVVRLPLEDLTVAKLNNELELPPPYQRSLHHWACYRALCDEDAEVQDLKKAEAHRAMFMAEFGEDSTAIEEEWARQHYGDSPDEAEL